MKKSLFITIAVFIASALLINSFLKDPTFDNLNDEISFEKASNQPDLAEKSILKLLESDSLNIDKHYDYIQNHFNIPSKTKIGKNDYRYRKDGDIVKYYESLVQSEDSNLADIGYYGSGLIHIIVGEYEIGLNNFAAVKNQSLKYLNNSIGYAYLQVDSVTQADKHFITEIQNKGNIDGAYANLIESMYKQGEFETLKQLLQNKEVKPYFPDRIAMAIYFKSFQPVKYAEVLFSHTFSGFNLYGFLAALLIMGSWLLYLRKIDIFEAEPWIYILFVLGLGMLFSFLTFPLSDFNNLIFKFKLNGNPGNDFLYSVLGIGMVEEFVKIVPLLIMLRFTKAINEPFDYIFYASLSALGFAFIENLIYFGSHNLFIVHGRALTAVVSHMFDSSIIAYGMILNKYKRHWNPLLNFLIFFNLAALSHGFYDFWLINQTVSELSFFTFIFLLMSMFMWNSFKNNALNQSTFYDKDVSINKENLHDYLMYSLSGILLFEYVALAFKYGPSVANDNIFSSLYSGTYLIVFLSGNLSRITLNKGLWAPINFKDSGAEEDFDGAIDQHFKINRITMNEFTELVLPNSGIITKRLTISNEPDWYLLKLDDTKTINAYLPDTVVIRTKERDEQIAKGKQTIISFYLIPSNMNLDSDNLKRTELKFCGWAKVE